jgi:predicted phosphodiesterase
MTRKINRTPERKSPPIVNRRVRVVCISDTHELHRELALPDGDLLIHAGDFTFWNHASKINDFNDWLGELPHRYKVVIPGNHDRAFNQDPQFREMITNAVLLINQGVRLCGLNIWGSPVTCDDDAHGPRQTGRARQTIREHPKGHPHSDYAWSTIRHLGPRTGHV